MHEFVGGLMVALVNTVRYSVGLCFFLVGGLVVHKRLIPGEQFPGPHPPPCWGPPTSLVT